MVIYISLCYIIISFISFYYYLLQYILFSYISEELEKIEAAAGQEEIQRLLEMEVLKEPSSSDLENGSILTTRSVFDWRVRSGRWKRRCRFVAREFRGHDQTTSETFAPTSSLAATRLLLATHAILQWKLNFIDVKDAFLLVPQTKLVLVEQPAWWKPEELEGAANGAKRYWRLARCLPGQRDAASRWFDYLKMALEELGMENHLSLPSLFRHKEKDLGMVCHVDDLIVAGREDDLTWFLDKMRSRFVISESGTLPQLDQDAREPVRCLKKRHYFTSEGIVIAPHEKYVPGLIELYNLSQRAGKATPESTQMDLEGSPEDVLTGGDQHRFRSALGTLLYISQDRIDIQHSVRNLSQFMASPTKKAESELKHLILYLKRTEQYGILLPYTKYKSKKAEILLQPDSMGDVDELESWSDSDWAGDRSSQKRRRHSVSSVMIFLNGCLVSAWSRSQKSIALSSCEAEFLASAGGAAEALQLKELWQFLTSREVMIKTITDSSSCRAFTERLGVGRLKHIDTRYLWMQLEVKKKTLRMEGIPTLWNMADLGTKRLSRQRREFLMFLIGVMEMNVEGAEQFFCHVGEETFHEEVRKKNLALKMKEVRSEMISALVEEKNETKVKVSKSMVKMVTLLLLNPGAYGQQENESEENFTTDESKSQIFQVMGWLTYILMFAIYTILVMSFGMWVGYTKWKIISRWLRKVKPYIQGDWFVDFYRDEDQQPTRSGLDLREWAVRASVEATGGEWIREPPPALPEPLRRRRGGSRVGRQREGPEGSFDEEEEVSQSSRGRRRPREEEGEEEEERSQSRDDVMVDQFLTDWDPVLQRLRPYRILNSSNDAESGEEFFVLSPNHGYRRLYRPTASERNEEAEIAEMEVDESDRGYSEVPLEGTTLPDDDYLWEAYERDEPPEALDWSKLENCIRYLSEDEERRARRLLATGLFSREQFTQYVQARLTCKFGEWYPFLRFDHALGWDEEYKRGFSAWCVAVMSRQWEDNWRERVARYAMEGEI